MLPKSREMIEVEVEEEEQVDPREEEERDYHSAGVSNGSDGKKGTERRERVNNLRSDESIVLRRAHATAPIMALRLVEASTELLHSHIPLEPGYSTVRHPRL